MPDDLEAFKEEIRNLSPEKRPKACEETGDRWLSEGRCVEAVTAFQAMIDAERELGESPAGLGNSYLRLARALVESERRRDADKAMLTALRLMQEGHSTPEIVGAAFVGYGLALYGAERYTDAAFCLRIGRSILIGHATEESLGSVEYYLGLSLRGMIEIDDLFSKARELEKIGEPSKELQDIIAKYDASPISRDFPNAREEAADVLSSAITRFERIMPSPALLEPARKALHEVEAQK